MQDQAIHPDTYSPSSVKSNKVTTSLYPYQSNELKVMFVYGTDFKRQKYQIFHTERGEEAFYLLSAFMMFAAALVRTKYAIK